MGKCKVHVHRLTLVLGALGNVAESDEGDVNDEDEYCALEWEHHRRAMDRWCTCTSSRSGFFAQRKVLGGEL
jgi:hypothetical protein